MRNGLYMFRHRMRLSQAETAERIGCDRGTYAAIENGKRNGRATFWNNLKKAFGLSDAEIDVLKKVDNTQEKENNK